MTINRLTVLSVLAMIVILATFEVLKYSTGVEFNLLNFASKLFAGIVFIAWPLYHIRKQHSGDNIIKYRTNYGSLMLTIMALILLVALASRVYLLQDVYFSSPIPMLIEFFVLVGIAMIIATQYLPKNEQAV